MGKRTRKKVVGFTGMKRCLAGEIYRFKRGVAQIPGFYMTQSGSLRPVFITFKEFGKLNREGSSE